MQCINYSNTLLLYINIAIGQRKGKKTERYKDMEKFRDDLLTNFLNNREKHKIPQNFFKKSLHFWGIWVPL